MINQNRRNHSVYTVAEINDRIATSFLAGDLTRKEAFDLAKKTAGKGAEFGKYGSAPGSTSIAYVGAEVTAVVSWSV